MLVEVNQLANPGGAASGREQVRKPALGSEKQLLVVRLVLRMTRLDVEKLFSICQKNRLAVHEQQMLVNNFVDFGIRDEVVPELSNRCANT